MATKLRLQRQGKKGKPYFHIVAADERAKRDGKYIERIGYYNPNTNPATIEIDFDRALNWVEKGAVPTDTMRAILSYKGVIYKNHLNRGVLKGAMTQEQADAKFDKWLQEKEAKVQAKKDGLAKSAADQEKKRLATEKEQSDARAKEIQAKNSEVAEAAAAEAVAEVATEAPAEEVAEAPVAEAATETPEATAEEAPKAEEAPAEEEKKED